MRQTLQHLMQAKQKLGPDKALGMAQGDGEW